MIDLNIWSTLAIYEFYEPSFMNILQQKGRIYQIVKEFVSGKVQKIDLYLSLSSWAYFNQICKETKVKPFYSDWLMHPYMN